MNRARRLEKAAGVPNVTMAFYIIVAIGMATVLYIGFDFIAEGREGYTSRLFGKIGGTLYKHMFPSFPSLEDWGR